MYQVSTEVANVHELKVDILQEVSGAHETMKNNALIACSRHNEAIDLITASGNYKESWNVECQISPLKFSIALDDITIEIKTHQSPHALINKEMVRHRIGLIANIDRNHPIVKHWKVLRDRCFAPGQDLEVWTELDEGNHVDVS